MPDMAKKQKILTNVICLGKKTPLTKAEAEKLAEPATPLGLTPKRGWETAVAMLQQTIDDIESGRMKPQDIFIVATNAPSESDQYAVHIRRFNLTPLELIGRMSHVLRDLDP